MNALPAGTPTIHTIKFVAYLVLLCIRAIMIKQQTFSYCNKTGPIKRNWYPDTQQNLLHP